MPYSIIPKKILALESTALEKLFTIGTYKFDQSYGVERWFSLVMCGMGIGILSKLRIYNRKCHPTLKIGGPQFEIFILPLHVLTNLVESIFETA